MQKRHGLIAVGFFQQCNLHQNLWLLGGKHRTQKAKFLYFVVKGAQPYPEGMGSLF
jgi:hypothetical protein